MGLPQNRNKYLQNMYAFVFYTMSQGEKKKTSMIPANTHTFRSDLTPRSQMSLLNFGRKKKSKGHRNDWCHSILGSGVFFFFQHLFPLYGINILSTLKRQEVLDLLKPSRSVKVASQIQWPLQHKKESVSMCPSVKVAYKPGSRRHLVDGPQLTASNY